MNKTKLAIALIGAAGVIAIGVAKAGDRLILEQGARLPVAVKDIGTHDSATVALFPGVTVANVTSWSCARTPEQECTKTAAPVCTMVVREFCVASEALPDDAAAVWAAVDSGAIIEGQERKWTVAINATNKPALVAFLEAQGVPEFAMFRAITCAIDAKAESGRACDAAAYRVASEAEAYAVKRAGALLEDSGRVSDVKAQAALEAIAEQ